MSVTTVDQRAEEIHNALAKSDGVIEPWMCDAVPNSLLMHIVISRTAKPFDIADLVDGIEADGRRDFQAGLDTAWIPYKASWQGASSGESQMREAWLRGWKRAATEAFEAKVAASPVDPDEETGSLIWGQSVGSAHA